MKKNAIIVSIIGVLILIIAVLGLISKKNFELYSNASNNYKAEMSKNDSIKIEYRLTADELKASKDSAMIRINELLKDNNLKAKQIQKLQYLQDTYTKTDTLIVKDTLFKDAMLNMDTTLTKDDYYKLNIKLKYPSTIIVSPTFYNEKLIVFKYKKETIKPKKCWPIYWFQKKHIVCNIEVIDSNPYMISKNNRFIEFVKD